MYEVPHRVVVDLQAALGNEPAQGEIAASDPLRQPDCVFQPIVITDSRPS
jgi:hypothetical protein